MNGNVKGEGKRGERGGGREMVQLRGKGGIRKGDGRKQGKANT